MADLQKEYGVDVIINIPDSDTHIWYFDFEKRLTQKGWSLFLYRVS